MNSTAFWPLAGLVALGLAGACADDKTAKDASAKKGAADESCLTACDEGSSAKSGKGKSSGSNGDDDDDDDDDDDGTSGTKTGSKSGTGKEDPGTSPKPPDPAGPANPTTAPLRDFTSHGFVGSIGIGGGPVYAPYTGAPAKVGDRFFFNDTFRFGVRIAAGDFDGDGALDFAGGLGKDAGPVVKVVNGGGATMVGDFFAFEDTFRGGVYLGACDLDGDKKDELLVGAGETGGPVVKIYKFANGAMNGAGTITAFDPNARLGAVPGCGDVTGDGKAEIFVTTGNGGGPAVEVWSYGDGTPTKIKAFMADYPADFRGGLFTAGGDMNGDGHSDIIVAPGTGGGPIVTIYDGKTFGVMKAFAAYEDSLRCGLRVAAFSPSNAAAAAWMAVVPGEGCSARIKVFALENGAQQQKLDEILADPTFRGGGFVGGVARR